MYKFLFASISVVLNGVAQAETQLEPIQVEESRPLASDAVDLNSNAGRAGNGSLGSYLDGLPNVDSASYGEGVGRPVVRGMSGYRVKILHNDAEFSDLSAMSQDHAVAVAPRASERIELLKGPASLLYAASAGGIVRVSDALDSTFPATGLHGEQALDWRPDPAGITFDSRISLANERWSLRLGGLHQDNDPYEADGKVVPDSGVETRQGQLALGWKPNARHELHLNTTQLDKDYGIPNATTESTGIEMQRDDIALKWRSTPALTHLDQITLDLLDSDYLHAETEAGRRDGLFGQNQTRAALQLDWVAGGWVGETRLAAADASLQVCHEHGACDGFSRASRNGEDLGEALLQYLQSTGLPYSHGHPMPDTHSDTWQWSSNAQKTLANTNELSLGLHWEHRQLEADPQNIQQQWVFPASVDADYYDRRRDNAVSASVGLQGQMAQSSAEWELSLSYLERLPSTDELFWNGFHHATDSYIFGDTKLDKERSLNLDLDVAWSLAPHYFQLSAFAYRFKDYIYQETGKATDGSVLIDPFHLSEVWLTQQADSDFLGASLRYENSSLAWRQQPLTWWLQLDLLDARLRHGGALPRTAPTSAETGLRFDTEHWNSSLTLKRVDRARNLAAGETSTAGYNQISLHVERIWQRGPQKISLWLKGENLGDSLAYNHLSFLKTTAPLPGRQVTLGLNWRF